MITDQSIELIKDVPITQVVGHFIKLNKHGKACCPFHNEKTASLSACDKKQIFNCFGCGQGGDGIKFVMLHEKKDFIGAVEIIAAIGGIQLVYQDEPENKEQYQQTKKQKDTLKTVVAQVVDTYHANLWQMPVDHPVKQYLAGRGIDRGDVATWQLGWAGDGWRSITPGLVAAENFEPAEKLGIIRRSKSGDQNYDGYRSRIIFPITNHHGECIGMAGRFMVVDPTDENKNYPKYINPPENELYNKSQVLYGISQATTAIHLKKFAWLVEGYTDVISMHKNGDVNTVATCGTALTTSQAALLKRYTDHVIVLRDGDAPGVAAGKKDIPILLKQGFKVDLAMIENDLDPDSFINQLPAEQKGSGIKEALKIQDGLTWMVADIVAAADGDNYKMGGAKMQALEIIAAIKNEMIRQQYFDTICKQYKWNKTDLSKQLNKILDDQADDQDLVDDGADPYAGLNKNDVLNNGYCIVKDKFKTGYYTVNANGKVRITNFIITPLFHVLAGKDSRHLIQVDNGQVKGVLDIESAALTSPDLLQKNIVNLGSFVITGNRLQFLNIAIVLLAAFPPCYEVTFLGWQEYGFFAYVDKIFIPGQGLSDLDKWGITKHKEKNYLVPAASAAYAELHGSSGDDFENDRVLTYKSPAMNFNQWCRSMNRVYFEKGQVAIAYVFLTVFRDVIFLVDNNCPHLYGFGEKSAGKSKWAESISAFFFQGRAAFNLNSGTDFAFFAYMQRFQNCPALLNEFDEKIIKPEWFQSIKGVFDGEGRQRGVVGSKNRTEIMKIKSTLVLTGQFLCTMDDNSIVSRSIIEGFNEREVTQDDKDAYDFLKDQEKMGLSGLLADVLKYRQEFKSTYQESFNENLARWRVKLSVDSVQLNQRIMQNWCHLYTSYAIMDKYLQMPAVLETFENYCKEKIIYWSGFIKTSDTLSEFWNTFAFLIDTGVLTAGWDYKIISERSVRVRKERKDEVVENFSMPLKVIYIRMNVVHKHYQQAYRQRTGKEGMSQENLMHYFSSRPYFIGSNKNSRFSRWVNKIEGKPVPMTGGLNGEYVKSQEGVNTNSIMFFYDQLGLDIEPTTDGQLDGGDPPDNPSLPFPLTAVKH